MKPARRITTLFVVVAGVALATPLMPAAQRQPLAFVGAARTGVVSRADSTVSLNGSRLFPNTDCTSVRIVFTVLGAGAGLGAGLAIDIASALVGGLSRSAATPVLVFTTLAGAGLGFLVANSTLPCQ